MSYEGAVEEVRARVLDGLSRDEAIVLLKDKGLTITESIKAVMAIFGDSLRESKSVVARHSAWEEMANAAKPLHDELENKFGG